MFRVNSLESQALFSMVLPEAFSSPSRFVGARGVGRTKLGGNELHREGVDTMARVRRGKTFSEEFVAQMAAAIGALDLRPSTVGIR